MPELPEVETIRRELEKEVVGRKIKTVEVTGKRTIRRQKPAEFIAGLEKIGSELDRRTLSEMAVLDPTGFDAVVNAARKALGLPEPAAVA